MWEIDKEDGQDLLALRKGGDTMNDPAELDLLEWGWYWSKRITPWVAGILLIGGSLAGAIWMIRQALGG